MEDILGEIGKGFLRAIGYLIAEIFYRTICYWIGWPICKIITFGKYPKAKNAVYFEERVDSIFWCCAIGLLTLIAVLLYFSGVFVGQSGV